MDRKTARKRAEELVGKMTLEEKASQLRYDAPAIERLGIPAYNWWNEALHGVARAGTATMFPQAIGMAACFDEKLMKEIGSCIGDEGRAKYNEESKRGDRGIYKGLTFWSPNVNIFRDPRWGRGHETYGEDPYLTARLGVNFIQGLQGEGEYMKAAACAKHFAVHSGPEALRHEFDARVSKKDLEETYLPAFEACVKEGKAEAVMGAYNRTNGEPCCASHQLIGEYLRGKWGFEGHFVSDCWAIRDFHERHKVTSRPEESVKMALEAGCDINCGCTYQRILDAVKEGLLDEQYVTQSCIRAFTTRFLLGMFDSTEYDSLNFLDVESPEHLKLASQAARESIVLLKNEGILPLQKENLRTIGVIGPNANSRRALEGNYHGTASRYVTVLEGIQKMAGEEVRVLYSEGCHLYLDRLEGQAEHGCIDRLAEAKTVAAYSDVVILVIGLDETLEGEEGDTGNSYASGDKADLEFPESQRKLMETLFKTGKPVVVVNMTGSAMDLRLAQEEAAAVLQAWYPGAGGGEDVAAVLFGECSPSGKLPVTFYESCDDLPEFTDYSMKNRTYRYYEGKPLYPFGYGLTYGDCRISDLKAEVGKREDGEFDGVTAVVTAENRGKRDTEEVVQIYLKDEEYPLAVPHPCLSAFARISLKAGERKTMQIKVGKDRFTSVDEEGIREIRSSRFTLYAGFSQPDERSRELTGHECEKIEISLP